MTNKKIVTAKALELGATFTKVRTKTVSFSGFGYGSGMFIQFDGLKWSGENKWDDLKASAKENGLILTSSI